MGLGASLHCSPAKRAFPHTADTIKDRQEIRVLRRNSAGRREQTGENRLLRDSVCEHLQGVGSGMLGLGGRRFRHGFGDRDGSGR